MPEKTYRVLWCVDIDADTPEDAAKQARAAQLDSESFATQFTVYEDSGKGTAWNADLTLGTCTPIPEEPT